MHGENGTRPAPQRRALVRARIARRIAHGCTAAILLAHGFKSDRLVELINAGLASVTTARVIADDRAMEVTRVRITDAGTQALDQPGRGDDCDGVLADPQACGGEPYLR
jgi:hypothetical protein